MADVFYYDLNVYTESEIVTYSLKDCLNQIEFLKKFNTPIFIWGGINIENAKKIVDVTSPNGLDISRSLKDENNDISLMKLSELQISLSAA